MRKVKLITSHAIGGFAGRFRVFKKTDGSIASVPNGTVGSRLLSVGLSSDPGIPPTPVPVLDISLRLTFNSVPKFWSPTTRA